MIKTATLTGALLDYYVARAEGVPAEQLEIRQVQRSADYHCVRVAQRYDGGSTVLSVIRYADWVLCGPLIRKHYIAIMLDAAGFWVARKQLTVLRGLGDTPQEAICRAVVRAAFGDEVEDV